MRNAGAGDVVVDLEMRGMLHHVRMGGHQSCAKY